MAFELPPCAYSNDALMPYMSPETLQFHYGKHHKAYVDNLNELIPGTEYEKMDLEKVVRASYEKKDSGIFNNAAQAWNHTFFWKCIGPKAGGEPKGEIADAIKSEFGSFRAFKEKFTDASVKQFGSGWGWLARNKSGKLEVLSTSNANVPFTEGYKPLLTCDVWEHAYYIDYRNQRPEFLAAFWKLVNWDFVSANFKGQS